MNILTKLALFTTFTAVLFKLIEFFFSKISLDKLVILNNSYLQTANYILHIFGVYSAISAYFSALAGAWFTKQILRYWV